jgi:hypothetical protein
MASRGFCVGDIPLTSRLGAARPDGTLMLVRIGRNISSAGNTARKLTPVNAHGNRARDHVKIRFSTTKGGFHVRKLVG